jgi:hypothetical protein
MSNRKLLILGIVAALMVVLVVIQGRMSRVPARTSSRGGYLIQGLERAQIASIVIGKGNNPVKLVRQGRRFVVGNKDDYPALVSKINNLLISCLDIRIMELITTNPVNHESLGVTEEKAQNVVKFLNRDGEVITGVVIGSSKLPELQMDKRSTYVRLISSNDVYEAKNVPLPGGSATDYIDKEIVDVSRSEVVRVAVTGPEGSYTLRVGDSNENDIILEDMPAGKKLKTSDCEQVLLALSPLSFDDVRKESSFEEGKLKFDSEYVSELKDATIYSFKIAKTDGKTYVKCSAEYTGETAQILESRGGLEDKEAKLVAHDRAVKFTGRHQGWVYEISEWKAKKLTRKLTELLEDEQKEEKADEPASTGSGEEAKSDVVE